MSSYTASSPIDSFFKKYSLTLVEFDVLTCLLVGKSSKSASAFLEIEPESYQLYINNIKKKMKISSKSAFKNLFQHDESYHYCETYAEILAFEKKLKQVASKQKFTLKEINISYNHHAEPVYLDIIKRHLSLFGVTVHRVLNSEKLGDDVLFFQSCNNEIPSFYMSNICLASSQPAFSYNDFFCELLEKLNIQYNINLIQDGITHFEGRFLLKKSEKIGFDFIIFIFFILFSALYSFFEFSKKTQILCRSDFPIVSPYIKRNSLFFQLQNTLERKKNKEENKRYAILSGKSGCGKNTLARFYAKKSSYDIIWEINGQSLSTVVYSFFNLAQSLAKTPQEQEELSSIKDIKDPFTQINHLVTFVQSFLKKASSWLFIFNKVESVPLIKSFLPSNLKECGNGSCIMIMCEKFSKNLPEEYKENLVNVNYLLDDEALKLFSHIYYKVSFSQLARKKQFDVAEILKQIPLYPLDIILAACDATRQKIHLKEYIDKLRVHHNYCILNNKSSGDQFVILREKSMQNIFKYIVSLGNQNKILLFMTSLFFPSDIPKSFLYNDQGSTVVKNFIKILKKNALVEEHKIVQGGKTIEVFSFSKVLQNYGFTFFEHFLTSEEFEFLLFKTVENIRNILKKEVDLDPNISLNWLLNLEKFIKKMEEFNSLKIKLEHHQKDFCFIFQRLNQMIGNIYTLDLYKIMNDKSLKHYEKFGNTFIDHEKISLEKSLFCESSNALFSIITTHDLLNFKKIN